MEGNVILSPEDIRYIKEIKKEFIEFLIKEGVLFQYLHNMQEQHPERKGIEGLFKEKGIEIFEKRGLIASSFYWTETPEGAPFWNQLDTKFQRNGKRNTSL